jgi:hypothetical protein
MTPTAHKEYMESILKQLSQELFIKQPLEEGGSLEEPPTPLQTWINKGKILIKEEIENAEEFVEELKMNIKNMQEIINSCNKALLQHQGNLNSKLIRLDNLNILLSTILM